MAEEESGLVKPADSEAQQVAHSMELVTSFRKHGSLVGEWQGPREWLACRGQQIFHRQTINIR